MTCNYDFTQLHVVFLAVLPCSPPARLVFLLQGLPDRGQAHVEAQVLADVLAGVLLPRGTPARGEVLDPLDLTRKPGHWSNPNRHTFRL